jgi:hypothetical protein
MTARKLLNLCVRVILWLTDPSRPGWHRRAGAEAEASRQAAMKQESNGIRTHF